MHAFSRSMVELYSLAEQASYQEFPDAALRLLQRSLGFDGAVLGMGESGRDPHSQLQITQAHVHQRDEQILPAYGAVSGGDPVTRAFLRGLERPLAVDCQATYRGPQQALSDMAEFSRSHELRHLLLFGDQPHGAMPGRWLVLYRSTNTGFRPEDADYLHAAWVHLSRAIVIHRNALLDRQDSVRAQRASALVNEQGGIETADPQFLALLHKQWPDQAPHLRGRQLPPALLDALKRGVSYRGQQIEVSAKRQEHLWVCTARPLDSLALLTPGENAVARRFSAGLSSKEIARELGVAPNTVRTQITRVYAKLQVHDKAALAQRLMES
ncbi:helix-turn-helix transcriptional regulator [Roseateles oligotrophus]|uniref:Helix-turn-helix transcriptional regulator n=1 Tax=Roseateles oligotrophus TaxID=1769250 RepID=A0ABT2YF35_9BURK|nr:helix-turn-helix transcriptional regulator [Roseateles oligotrophus]MCV2368663.1 helix-turn-helix transcriptional regulator [Roseateles oligotrophus]